MEIVFPRRLDSPEDSSLVRLKPHKDPLRNPRRSARRYGRLCLPLGIDASISKSVQRRFGWQLPIWKCTPAKDVSGRINPYLKSRLFHQTCDVFPCSQVSFRKPQASESDLKSRGI